MTYPPDVTRAAPPAGSDRPTELLSPGYPYPQQAFPPGVAEPRPYPAQVTLGPMGPSPVLPRPADPRAVDPRAMAFGLGRIISDPATARAALQWGLPALTALVGLVVGLVLGGNGGRPDTPVPISVPVTATTTATAVSTQQVVRTKTAPPRHVTTTSVTTAPPVTETVTDTQTVTVTDTRTVTRRVGGGVPILPGGA